MEEGRTVRSRAVDAPYPLRLSRSRGLQVFCSFMCNRPGRLMRQRCEFEPLSCA